MIIPELNIKSVVDGILRYIREDYTNNVNKNETILYRLFETLSYGDYNIYDQAVEIFINRDESDPRFLKSNFFLNVSRASIPTIHIVLEGDTPGADGIGIDEGYNDPVFENDEIQRFYNRNFRSKIKIVITSDNTFETIVIFQTMRALLIDAFMTLEFSGIQNLKLSSGDLPLLTDIVPENIYARVIDLSFIYDIVVPKLLKEQTFKDIIIHGTYRTNNESSS